MTTAILSHSPARTTVCPKNTGACLSRAQLAAEITAKVNEYRGSDGPWLGNWKNLSVFTLERMLVRMTRACELKATNPAKAFACFMGHLGWDKEDAANQ